MKEKHGEFIPLIWDGFISNVEYVKGHVTEAEAKAAIDLYDGERFDDKRLSDSVAGVRHRWARWHLAGPYQDFTHVLHVQDEKWRGTFPVTELSMKGGAP